MVVKEGEFKSPKDGKVYPTLTLLAKVDDRYGFTFGLGKARLILANIDEIRKFEESHGNEESKEEQ
jgi:hypothetical protein